MARLLLHDEYLALCVLAAFLKKRLITGFAIAEFKVARKIKLEIDV